MFQLVICAPEGLGRDCLESLLRSSRRINVVAVGANLTALSQTPPCVTPHAVLMIENPTAATASPIVHSTKALWPAAELLSASYEPTTTPPQALSETPRIINLSGSAQAIVDAITGQGDAADHPRPEPVARTAVLTARETRVLCHLAEGLTARESADRLGLKSRTIDSHRRRISRKLGLTSTAHLTRFAIATGLVAAGPDGRHDDRPTPDRRPASDPDFVAEPVKESAVRALDR